MAASVFLFCVQIDRSPIFNGHLVEEPLVSRGADTEMAAIVAFGRLTQDVSGRVPEDTLAWHRIISALQHRVMQSRPAFGVREVEELERARLL